MIGIYKIASPSGKVYIGQSHNISERFRIYKGLWCVDQGKLYNSLRKHGIENHTFEIIHELPIDVSQEVLDQYEILYIIQYKDCGVELMNLKDGGSNGKHSEETKALIKERVQGKKLGNQIWLGRTHSEETKEKIRLSKLGKPSWNKGIPMSEETKKKSSMSKKGKIWKGDRQKVSERMKGNQFWKYRLIENQ